MCACMQVAEESQTAELARNKTWQDGNSRSSDNSVLSPSVRASLTPSALSVLQAQQSTQPGARPASPEPRGPHAGVPRASSGSFGSGSNGSGSFGKGSFSKGGGHSSFPLTRLGPSRLKRSRKKGGTGEPLLVIGTEGGSVRRTSRNESSFIHSYQLPAIGEDDSLHNGSQHNESLHNSPSD
ncbi:hypothetical protein DUNSADRAFT_11418 [Dunaliella salina]|uniref:Encoded protein n=1 Tax=Dunaliella salina TaxID=3046 RepID=A0ABQ7GDE6_DUNSA|nr:hypothetical protein DUNSADRAFT_11418 [Dunaliella salina]|eukprot:KAF5832632.1 hypothetical protein DUNSADRAFT_11418 [Dunaliella salina]